MIELQLTCGDNQEGVRLVFPATPAEIGEAFAWLDEVSRYAGEVQIIGVHSAIPNLGQYIHCADLSHSKDIQSLNTLAERIGAMEKKEQLIFSGALDSESVNGLDDVLRISESLGNYMIIPYVSSDTELGRYVAFAGQIQSDPRFPEAAWPYLDFAKIGAEYYADHGGAYTPNGYVLRKENESVQTQDRKPIFELYLLHGQIRYRLDLPAEGPRLELAKRSLGIEDFAQAAIYRTIYGMEPMAGILPMDRVSVEDANDLAQMIREMSQSYRRSSRKIFPMPCVWRRNWMTTSASWREPTNMVNLSCGVSALMMRSSTPLRSIWILKNRGKTLCWRMVSGRPNMVWCGDAVSLFPPVK